VDDMPSDIIVDRDRTTIQNQVVEPQARREALNAKGKPTHVDRFGGQRIGRTQRKLQSQAPAAGANSCDVATTHFPGTVRLEDNAVKYASHRRVENAEICVALCLGPVPGEIDLASVNGGRPTALDDDAVAAAKDGTVGQGRHRPGLYTHASDRVLDAR